MRCSGSAPNPPCSIGAPHAAAQWAPQAASVLACSSATEAACGVHKSFSRLISALQFWGRPGASCLAYFTPAKYYVRWRFRFGGTQSCTTGCHCSHSPRSRRGWWCSVISTLPLASCEFDQGARGSYRVLPKNQELNFSQGAGQKTSPQLCVVNYLFRGGCHTTTSTPPSNAGKPSASPSLQPSPEQRTLFLLKFCPH